MSRGDESGIWFGVGPPFKPGERVLILDGPFENTEATVTGVDALTGTVQVKVPGRPAPVGIEGWKLKRLPAEAQ